MQTGTNEVESAGTAQSTFMPSTMNAVRIHSWGGSQSRRKAADSARLRPLLSEERRKFIESQS